MVESLMLVKIESGDVKRALDSSEEFSVSVPSNTAAAAELAKFLEGKGL